MTAAHLAVPIEESTRVSDRDRATRRRERAAEVTAAARPGGLQVLWVGLVVLGLLTVGFVGQVFVVSRVTQARVQHLLDQRLRVDLANAAAPVGGVIAPGVPIARIEAPAIGLRQVVVEGSDSATTRSGPGHVRATPMPGQSGNSVVIGRLASYGRPFASIGSLQRGDRITVVTGQGRSRFAVVDSRTLPAGAKRVFTSAGSSNLTLVTAAGLGATDRWTVTRARLVGAPKPASAHLGRLDRAEVGVVGLRLDWTGMLVRLGLLVAGALAVVWLLRRFPGSTVWLVAAPVLLALAWPLLEELARALPPTL